MKIHALINYYIADLGTIQEWATNNGHDVTTTHVYENVNFPKVEEFDMLIILGGVAGAYEEDKYPWLIHEKKFIKETIEAGKVVLGICLGAQLIAEVIGGRVYHQGYLEVGWWDVSFTKEVENIPLFKNLPRELPCFQYHQDTFELPDDAINVAKSEACKNQVFVYVDRVVGLQFHPEFTEEKLREIVDVHGHQMREDSYSQLPEDFLNKKENVQKAKTLLFTLLDNLEEKVAEYSLTSDS